MPAKQDAFTPGLLSRLAEPPRKVVLMRASRIGDFLCATPAFRALRCALPRAEITLITLPMLRELAIRLPYIDRVEDFPGFPGIAEQLFDARRTLCFLHEMQEEQFDLAVQMQGSGAYSNPFMLLLGAKTTAGFVRPGDPPGLLDAALPCSEAMHEMHTVLALATFLGAPAQYECADFPLWPVDREVAEDLLKGAEPPLIGIHPAARDAERRWSVARFGAVGNALRERYGGTIIVIGEREEQATGDTLARQIGRRCLNFVGKTPLTALGAVISRLAVLVTNDTGPAHIAYALRTPTVTIFGAGNPRRYGPPQHGPYRVLAFPDAYRPCGYTKSPTGYLRLEGITVSQVMQVVTEVIHLS